MFFIDGNMYLTDLDSMGEVGTFDCIDGTRGYLAPAFLYNSSTIIHDNSDRDQPINAYKKDHYTFFMTMMRSCLSVRPVFGTFTEDKIDLFLQNISCNPSMKIEIKLFLLDPAGNQLSHPLASYCG